MWIILWSDLTNMVAADSTNKGAVMATAVVGVVVEQVVVVVVKEPVDPAAGLGQGADEAGQRHVNHMQAKLLGVY